MKVLNNPFLRGVIFALILIVLSCKKEKSIPMPSGIYNSDTTTAYIYDTIFPLSYFPVYPASWWKYVDSNNDTIIIRTDSFYQKDYYYYGSAAYTSDTFFVPIYNNVPIWGYEAHTGPISNAGSYPLTQILSESLPIGTNWFILIWSGGSKSIKIIDKDATITISSNSYYPTIVVEEYYSNGPPYYIWTNRRYYTKNIGQFKEEINNDLDTTINTRDLVDYYINH